MLSICVQSGGLEDLFGVDEAYRLISAAGFQGVDANVNHLLMPQDIRDRKRPAAFTLSGEASLAYFRPWKEAAEKYGLINEQAHAPYPSCLPEDDEYNLFLMEALKKTIAGCAYIGCRRLIVHPFFMPYDHQVSPQEEWTRNIRDYSALIPAAKEHHVTICLENMFMTRMGKRYGACCSDLHLACDYVDALNAIAGERVFGFCLDTGHLLLTGQDPQNAVALLGDRLEALHIHDNNGQEDQHLAPYMGVLDWDRFVAGLRDAGYRKPLSFETFNVIRRFDPALAPYALRLIAETGKMFARRLEGEA